MLHIDKLRLAYDTRGTLDECGVRYFNSKFNRFMADFGCTSSFVKNKIFEQYCMVIYGYQNCALYIKDIGRLYVTIRNNTKSTMSITISDS